MCSIGRTDSLFTDSQACYMGADARLHQCICPITTCTLTGNGYGCTMTGSFMVLCGILILVWVAAAAAYVYITNHINLLEMQAKQETKSELRPYYYYEKLFGPGSAPGSRVASPTIAVPMSSKE